MFSWALCNTVIIASFTTLAIHFYKWWIVLFAALFTFGWKSKNTDEPPEEESKG